MRDEPFLQAMQLTSEPGRFDDFCGLLAGVHAEESQRHAKAVRLGRQGAGQGQARATTKTGVCGHQEAAAVAQPHSDAVSSQVADSQGIAKALTVHPDAILKGLAALWDRVGTIRPTEQTV